VSTPARPSLLGILVPATIVCTFGADVTARLLPHDLFSFRAWEAMRTPGDEAPFLTNHRYHNDRTYGNLSAIGNLPASRQYRSVTFTTDELGYGNPPDLAKRGAAAALVFGSSFSAGAELGDGHTFSAQLGGLAGRTVYNAGGGDPSLVAQILPLARRLLVPGGWVIYEYLEGREVPPITLVHVPRGTARCHELLAPRGFDHACSGLGWLDRHLRVSPVEIVCQRAVKRLQDGQWLPNPYAPLVLRERLRDGHEMLFLGLERGAFHRAPPAEPAARYLRWLGEKLAAAHVRLLVVLASSKYTTYAPLLLTPDPGPEESVRYLAELERQVREGGVPVVNLTAPLRAAAVTALARGDYIYFPDDTHWNTAGAGIAAREVWQVWRVLADEASLGAHGPRAAR